MTDRGWSVVMSVVGLAACGDLDDPPTGPPPSCAMPQFGAPPALALNYTVAGDFDGDDLLDLVGFGAMSAGFARGTGDGTFEPPSEIPTTIVPWTLTAGDFDGDGHLDLAGGSRSLGGRGAVLRGRGDGTFATEVLAPIVTDNPEHAVTGDFNADGHLDLAVSGASNLTPKVSVLFGKGDGTFRHSIALMTNALPNNGVALLAADLDGDGDVDLVTGDFYSDRLEVFFANGQPAPVHQLAPDGTTGVDLGWFQRGQPLALGGTAGAESMTAADLNRDGHVDLAVTRYVPSGVTLLLGNGNGTFQAPREIVLGTSLRSIVAIDVDGDLDLDLVATDAGALAIARGHGDGTFATPTRVVAPVGEALRTGDFDNDGTIDLVVSPGTTSVLLGDGLGSFQTALIPLPPSSSIAVVDFDGDSVPDAVTTPVANGALVPEAHLHRGRGDGTFEPAVILPTHSGSKRVIAADLDGDGSFDIATSNEESVSVLLNRGNGTFAPSQTILALPGMARHRAIVAADFNSDGTLDLAVTTEDWGGASPTITVALGTGSGTFQVPRENPGPPYIHFIAAGDFDRDGSLDLALSNGALYIMRGLGDGGLAPPTMIYDGGSIETGGLVVTDLDGDDLLDLLATNGTGTLQHHPGKGDGTFAPPLALARAGNPDVVADLNHDGLLDVVARGGGVGPPIGLGSTGVTLVLGRGGLAFDAPLYYPIGLTDSYESATVADFDGNGLLDIAAPGGILLQRTCAPGANTMP